MYFGAFIIFYYLYEKYIIILFNNSKSDFQNKGVIAILFNELQKFYNKFGITEVETNPELIENAAIQQLWKNYENNQHKNRATFTKVI